MSFVIALKITLVLLNLPNSLKWGHAPNTKVFATITFGNMWGKARLKFTLLIPMIKLQTWWPSYCGRICWSSIAKYWLVCSPVIRQSYNKKRKSIVCFCRSLSYSFTLHRMQQKIYVLNINKTCYLYAWNPVIQHQLKITLNHSMSGIFSQSYRA